MRLLPTSAKNRTNAPTAGTEQPARGGERQRLAWRTAELLLEEDEALEPESVKIDAGPQPPFRGGAKARAEKRREVQLC
ncbi:hypothetical protein MHYP_G00074050 [Metynnis hypsauchen]